MPKTRLCKAFRLRYHKRHSYPMGKATEDLIDMCGIVIFPLRPPTTSYLSQYNTTLSTQRGEELMPST
jgi:hypothetical protein